MVHFWSLHFLSQPLEMQKCCWNVMYIFFFLTFGFIYLFIYLCLCWAFVSVQGLSLVVASGGHSSSRCAGLSLSRRLLLRSTGSRRAGSVVVAHGPSCSAACGIFPDQGSNPSPLHWQVDSQPLRHQGSPVMYIFKGPPTPPPFPERLELGQWAFPWGGRVPAKHPFPEFSCQNGNTTHRKEYFQYYFQRSWFGKNFYC